MRDIDDPRRGHGVQVMWEFSVEHANMERSRYFGFSSGTGGKRGDGSPVYHMYHV